MPDIAPGRLYPNSLSTLTLPEILLYPIFFAATTSCSTNTPTATKRHSIQFDEQGYQKYQ